MKRSDEAAYREYVAARMEPLRRTAYLFCRNWHTADDLVSVTIGKLYRNWHRAREVDNLDAYVQRILLRVWLDEKRRPWRREEATDQLPEQASTTEPGLLDRAWTSISSTTRSAYRHRPQWTSTRSSAGSAARS